MKYFFIINLLLAFFFFNETKANSLLESLSQAYKNNPKLNAERSNVRAKSEGKNQALSEFKPSVTISGYISEQDNTRGDESNIEPSEKSLLIEQKIFQGFAGVANLKKENLEIDLANFKLKKIEQEILLSSVDVHTNFLLNRKKVEIFKKNIDLLERQLETDRTRLERGEISLTDLAQSEASLAGGNAQLISAENNLITSIANFEKIIGKNPDKNLKYNETINLNLPRSLSEAKRISNIENPDLKIALIEYQQSKEDINIAAAEHAPTATLSYEIAEQDNISSTVDERIQQTIKAKASWPIYSGGAHGASLRQAKESSNQKKLLLEDAKKKVSTGVANAWSNLQSAKSVLNSIVSQVKAAEIANEGITQEYESGKDRTTLDVIQSRSILLDSRINLANSERNLLMAKFNLLSTIGNMTAKHFNLNN